MRIRGVPSEDQIVEPRRDHQQEENENKNLRCYRIASFRFQVAFGGSECVQLTCFHLRFSWSFSCSSQAPKMNRSPLEVDRLNDATFSLTAPYLIQLLQCAFYHSTESE